MLIAFKMYSGIHLCSVTLMLRIAIEPPVLQAAALSPVQTVEADASVHLIKASNVMPKGIGLPTFVYFLDPNKKS